MKVNSKCCSRFTIFIVLVFAAIVSALGVPTTAVFAEEIRSIPASKPEEANHLRIAAVRSAYDLGIIEALTKKFQEKNPRVRVSIIHGGVLNVLKQAREGFADVTITHHKPGELNFLAEGYATHRTTLMYTEYALFGPPGDKLGLTKLKDIESVFKKIAAQEAEFFEPSPQSGTNIKIQELWSYVGISPDWLGYENTGASGYATLLQAAEFGAFAIAEMATYITNRDVIKGRLVPLFRDDLNLRNEYSLMVVNPDKIEGVNSKLAMAFHDYLVSVEGQDDIKSIGEDIFNAMVLQPAAHMDPGLRAERAKRDLVLKSQELKIVLISSIVLFAFLGVSLFLFIRMRLVERKHSETQLRNETLVAAQNKILQTNKLLQSEIEERRTTERRLSEAIGKLNDSERELKKYHDHLESLVSSRTKELEIAVKELQAFSYSVSHDLRAPLRSINGFSHSLLEGYSDILDDDGKDSLNRIINASIRMGDLIDGLLQLSRLSSQELKPTDINLGEITRDIFYSLQDDIADRDIILEIDNEMFARGDSNLVRVVLENLISNALKYTSKNEQAIITVGKVYRNSNLCFFVKDNGVGFEMKYAEKLFGPFQRLHADEEFKGNGIGLSTVQRIVHLHDGVIWTESTPGEGAIFYFTLTPFLHEASMEGDTESSSAAVH